MNVVGGGPVYARIEVPTSGNTPALSIAPAGDVRGRVIVLPGIHGRTPFFLQVGQRLAANGFEAVIADFYCTAAQRGEIRSPADIGVATDALDHESITSTVVGLIDSLRGSSPIAVLGYCVGGTFALLTAARSEAIVATVAYYGVLHQSGALAAKRPDPIKAAGVGRSPLLAHYGNRDIWIPAEDIDELEAEVAEHDRSHAIYRYPGAGHAFEETENRGFRPVAAAEASARTLTFLDYYIGK